jgi:primosomal protein N' (replication factor Y)
MALLRGESAQRNALDGFMAAARDALAQAESGALRTHGPFAAPMPLRAGRHRAQLLLESAQRPALRHALAAWLPQLHALPQPRGLRWSIDIDPVDLY